jgi:Ca2+-binding EF-hand superfamily protein
VISVDSGLVHLWLATISECIGETAMTTGTMSLLERKYAKRFEMLDVDGSGVIDRMAFELLARRVLDGSGATRGSPKADRVRDGYLELWSSLQRMVDEDGDGEITVAEFVTGMTRMAGDRPGFKRVIEPLARLSLSLCDADGDGYLDEAELANLLRVFNAMPISAAGTIFRRLDSNADGLLSQAEILEALCDFYISTDSQAPGDSGPDLSGKCAAAPS